MVKRINKQSGREQNQVRYCACPQLPPRTFAPDVGLNRAALILRSDRKWVNGTVLHYHYLGSPAKYRATDAQKAVIRKGFEGWKAIGIGLQFKEVQRASEAEVRIAVERDAGHWSYVGRDILSIGANEPTMNVDKGAANFNVDTAMHEIGHTLGFPHEHQNPNAGIEWNEEAVYTALAKPPNRWPRSRTYHNIIRKLNPSEVHGSQWDPDSIMHYEFEAGLINKPERYRNGLHPAPGLSNRDKQWVRSFYPPLNERDHRTLNPFESVKLRLAPTEQANFVIRPDATRNYTFQIFGQADTVMVLFETIDGEPRFLDGSDDSGRPDNATIQAKLFAGRKYVLRVRLYVAEGPGDLAVMMW